ncbi:hypothetical protein [Pseudobacillus wudalianchiensis]|uniref:Uncharacterized protein n=1 Tax=Pseudobacillus wudalianchiensis TaxID=1743143 RepID=A0A1B9AN52_9BACI|nr:hypothetical protein [Bacillus wudalianchiensis]OCA85272.1 hypothetical protein A8F95_11415 [Bacillus wudalianchiensis]
MKKYLKLFISIVFLLVGFSVFNQPAEAAKNPINPKQSRVTYTLKDANGVAYKVYFAGVREKKARASYDHEWAHVWAGAAEGDLLYKGDYTLYTQKAGTSQIKKSSYYFKNYILNATRKTVHMYPSKYKGQPDILAVSEPGSSNLEMANWYYIKNGVLVHITEIDYTERAQILKKNQFLTAFYDNSDGKWYFSGMNFNPTKNTFETFTPVYKNPNAVIRNWKKHWQ